MTFQPFDSDLTKQINREFAMGDLELNHLLQFPAQLQAGCTAHIAFHL